MSEAQVYGQRAKQDWIVEGLNVKDNDNFDRLYRQQRETNDRDLRERLILSGLPMVDYTIKKFGKRFPSIDKDDFFSEGYIALQKAFDSYEPRQNGKFSSFAFRYIEGGILTHIRKMGEIIRTPEEEPDIHFVSLQDDVGFEGAKLEDYLGDPYSEVPFNEIEQSEPDDVILDVSDIFSDATHHIVVSPNVALENPLLTPTEKHFLELGFGVNGSFPYSFEEISEKKRVGYVEVIRTIHSAINRVRQDFDVDSLEDSLSDILYSPHISERDKEILIKRRGFYGSRKKTYMELGRFYGITRVAVSRAQKRAEQKLKKGLEGKLDTPPTYEQVINSPHLSDRDKDILVKRHNLDGNGICTQTELGEIYGISRSYAGYIQKRAEQKLKKGLEGKLDTPPTYEQVINSPHLSDRDKDILVKRHNLDGNGTYTLVKLGEIYGITKQKVSYTQKKAEQRLKMSL